MHYFLIIFCLFFALTNVWERTRPNASSIYDVHTIKDDKNKMDFIQSQFEERNWDAQSQLVLYQPLGDIYANPQSNFYNPKEALRAYFRNHITQFSILYEQEKCAHRFSSYSENLINSDIHAQVLSSLVKFCVLSNEDLFILAEDFETKGDQYFVDSLIALGLYQNLSSREMVRPYTPEIWELKKIIFQKIKKLRAQRHTMRLNTPNHSFEPPAL